MREMYKKFQCPIILLLSLVILVVLVLLVFDIVTNQDSEIQVSKYINENNDLKNQVSKYISENKDLKDQVANYISENNYLKDAVISYKRDIEILDSIPNREAMILYGEYLKKLKISRLSVCCVFGTPPLTPITDSFIYHSISRKKTWPD